MAFPEISPATARVLERRITPKTREVMARGLETFGHGLGLEDPREIYRGLVEFGTSSIFGEKASLAIDWTKPPTIGIPERRFLRVLGNIGTTLRNNEIDQTRRIFEGVTCIKGSTADSGGPPCNPEILMPIVFIKGYLEPILERFELTQNFPFRNDCAALIERVVDGYSGGDRWQAAEAIMEFGVVAERFSQAKEFDYKLTDIRRKIRSFFRKSSRV